MACCPVGSGIMLTLQQVSQELSRRLSSIFLMNQDERRPCHGMDTRFAGDPHWPDLVLFHEYFHGDTGRGLGASHQTGWTALSVKLLEHAQYQRLRAFTKTKINVVRWQARQVGCGSGRTGVSRGAPSMNKRFDGKPAGLVDQRTSARRPGMRPCGCQDGIWYDLSHQWPR
jgi:hypothetical protein